MAGDPDFYAAALAALQAGAPGMSESGRQAVARNISLRCKAALRASDTGRSEAEAMAHLLREAEPTIMRQGSDIVLLCPDGTITDDIYDALERACDGRTALSQPAKGEDDAL